MHSRMLIHLVPSLSFDFLQDLTSPFSATDLPVLVALHAPPLLFLYALANPNASVPQEPLDRVYARLRLIASEEIDVGVAACGAAEERPVRVKRCCGDRGAAVLEEARVRLEVGQLLAVEVEHLGGVGGCTPAATLAYLRVRAVL